MLADGDGVADLHLATDGEDTAGVEATVGPHGELTFDSGVAHSAYCFPQKVRGARAVLAGPFRSRAISPPPSARPLGWPRKARSATTTRASRLIVRRVKPTPDSQLALFTT